MTLHQLHNPWTVDEGAFPTDESPAAKWHFLLNYAAMAPSVYNTQPWLFRVSGDELEMYKDRSRNLAVLDPEQRELIISCGTALSYLETAVRHFGYRAIISTFPEIGKADLLARVQLRFGNGASAILHEKFKAIKHSEINLLPFDSKSRVPAEIQAQISEAAVLRGIEARWIHSPDRMQSISELVSRAHATQQRNQQLSSEWSDWMHPLHCEEHDGMPLCHLPVDHLSSDLDPLITRTFVTNSGKPADGSEIADGSGSFLILGISRDNPVSWLSVGQAVGDAILELHAAGWQTSFLNQAVEESLVKAELAELTNLNSPQVVIRVGGGPPAQPLPRRSVHQILFNPYRERGRSLR